MNEVALDTLTQRLGRLERENRRLKLAGVVLLGAERVRLEAFVCRYCGHTFDPEEAERQVEKAKAEFEEQ